MDRLARDKHSSLLDPLISWVEDKVFLIRQQKVIFSNLYCFIEKQASPHRPSRYKFSLRSLNYYGKVDKLPIIFDMKCAQQLPLLIEIVL